ncbi:MAG: RsmB/NOP family class I SAM-dependent RNA methyltransferase, partial [bacterium]
MLPVVVLDPKPGESVLDMCAAPGSKTTQIASAMRNQGLIVANDTSLKRLRSLVFNLRRMGVTNTVVCKGFGEQYGNQYFETLQRVLVDPPCSALGTLHKSPEVLSWWTPGRTEKLAGIQFRLVESGLKALKPGGILAYSTCTITPEENEQVLNRILKKYPVEIEPFRLAGVNTRPGLTRYKNQHYRPELSRAIRLYPWDNQSEAFFVARLRKLESFGTRNGRKSSLREEQFLPGRDASIKPHLDFLADRFGIDPSTFSDACYSLNRDLSCTSSALMSFPLSGFFVKAGLPIAHIRNRETLLTTEGAHLFGHLATRRIVPLDLDLLERYANRNLL